MSTGLDYHDPKVPNEAQGINFCQHAKAARQAGFGMSQNGCQRGLLFHYMI